MPDSSRGWLTNKNWVIATPMEVGIAPRERAVGLLEKIRRENVGPYGPYLSAVERQAMMTIATGVQAVAEARYGRIDQSLWYVGRIVETFNRTLPGSIERNQIQSAVALIYARAGEPEKSLDLIASLLPLPAEFPETAIYNLTTADLKWSWVWDPLRNDPRFQKLVAPTAPVAP